MVGEEAPKDATIANNRRKLGDLSRSEDANFGIDRTRQRCRES